MSRYGEPDMYTQAGDWLVNTARRKPEAVLLLAAGCALLMRNGRGAAASDRDHHFVPRYAGDSLGQQGRAAGTPPRSAGVGGAVNQVGETAAQYATGLKDRISETASSYGSAAADLAQEA